VNRSECRWTFNPTRTTSREEKKEGGDDDDGKGVMYEHPAHSYHESGNFCATLTYFSKEIE
jgi:hypothetical protein